MSHNILGELQHTCPVGKCYDDVWAETRASCFVETFACISRCFVTSFLTCLKSQMSSSFVFVPGLHAAFI